jgi:hypothetical protein
LDGGSARRTYNTKTEKKHTFIFRVGFEPINPLLDREKTIRAFDRMATVEGCGPGLFKVISTKAKEEKQENFQS